MSKNKPTRQLALIGAGYWGKNLARNFNSLGALHTLCDLNKATLDSYGAEYAQVRKTSDIEALWTDTEIKQVAIAAPAIYHYKLAKAALLGGKDVFVEKPLCLDLNEACELIGLAKERSLILMVGHLLQYHPHIIRLKQLVVRGDLGRLCYITSNRLNLGKIRREENALWSFAPHDLSVILSLAGGELPEQVRCEGGSYLTHGVHDTTVTTLRFANGLRGHVYVSWLNPFKEQKLTVVGERAMAVFDDTKPWAEKLCVFSDYLARGTGDVPVPNKVQPEFVSVSEGEPLRNECAHFLECSDARLEPSTNGAEGERVLRVLHAAQSSLEHNGEPQAINGL